MGINNERFHSLQPVCDLRVESITFRMRRRNVPTRIVRFFFGMRIDPKVRSTYILIIEPTGCTNFSNLLLE